MKKKHIIIIAGAVLLGLGVLLYYFLPRQPFSSSVISKIESIRFYDTEPNNAETVYTLNEEEKAAVIALLEKIRINAVEKKVPMLDGGTDEKFLITYNDGKKLIFRSCLYDRNDCYIMLGDKCYDADITLVREIESFHDDMSERLGYYGWSDYHDRKVYIFSDIEDCRKVSNKAVDSANVEIYASPEKDENAGSLTYESFFGCNYECDEFEFQIFAYEFADEITSEKYFENVTGRKPNGKTSVGTISGAQTVYRRTARFGKQAYCFYTETKNVEKVIEYLNRIFTVEIPQQ